MAPKRKKQKVEPKKSKRKASDGASKTTKKVKRETAAKQRSVAAAPAPAKPVSSVAAGRPQRKSASKDASQKAVGQKPKPKPKPKSKARETSTRRTQTNQTSSNATSSSAAGTSASSEDVAAVLERLFHWCFLGFCLRFAMLSPLDALFVSVTLASIAALDNSHKARLWILGVPRLRNQTRLQGKTFTTSVAVRMYAHIRIMALLSSRGFLVKCILALVASLIAWKDQGSRKRLVRIFKGARLRLGVPTSSLSRHRRPASLEKLCELVDGEVRRVLPRVLDFAGSGRNSDEVTTWLYKFVAAIMGISCVLLPGPASIRIISALTVGIRLGGSIELCGRWVADKMIDSRPSNAKLRIQAVGELGFLHPVLRVHGLFDGWLPGVRIFTYCSLARR